jgi:hypothetical protein
MSRDKIPYIWGKKFVILKPEEKMSVEFADKLRELTLQKQLRCLWCHIPNEGKRSLLTALIIKASGMIPGVGDFLFCWGGGSAFIELKAGKNKQSIHQKNFELWCKENDVDYALCYSVEAAIGVLHDWGLID